MAGLFAKVGDKVGESVGDGGTPLPNENDPGDEGERVGDKESDDCAWT